MIEIIGGVWAAGETKTFHINGGYLEILEAQYPVDVMLMDKAGAQLSIMRGSEASFFSRPQEGFNTIQIMSPQAQTVRVFVGSGDAGTRRTAGVVSVVDGGKARTLAGVAFMGNVSFAGVASQYSHVQLWNPAVSGRNLVVGQIQCNGVVAQGVSLRAHNAALAALFSVPPSKRIGAAASVAEFRTASASGYIPAGADVVAFSIQASATVQYKPTEPIVIPPGQGLVLFANNVQAALLAATFDFYEDAI